MQILTPDEVESLQRLLVEATPEEREWLDKVLMQQARFEQENPWSCYRGRPKDYCREILGVEYMTPAQEKIVDAVHCHPYRVNVEGAHGQGKAQPVDLVIETPDGKRRFGDLAPGDFVFGINGKPTEVVSIHPQGTRQCFKVSFDDGSFTLADGDHLWMVRHRSTKRSRIAERRANWSILTTSQILCRGVKQSNGNAKVRVWEMPPHEAVEYERKTVEIEPYTLGVWLGDGTCHTGRVTTSDREVVDWLAEENYCIPSVYEDSGSTALQVGVKGLTRKIRKIGLIGTVTHEKRVPKEYLENSIYVRLRVLQGLMDTDGTVGPDNAGNSITFCSTSEGLVDDVIWLVRSLGGKARKRKTPKRGWYRGADGERVNCRLAYQAAVVLPKYPLFRLNRKQNRVRAVQARYASRFIDAIEEVGQMEMMCIRVKAADSMYLANDFIPTHNTSAFGWLANYFHDNFKPSAIIISSPKFEHMVRTIFGEIRRSRANAKKRFPNLPMPFTGPRAPEMRDGDDHFVVGLTADRSEAYSGQHYEFMMFILDEAEGLEELYMRITGSMFQPNGKHIWICGSNPVGLASPLYLETRKVDLDGNQMWNVMNISALDHPNVIAALEGREPPIPAAVSLEQVRAWIAAGCEPIDPEEKKATDFVFPPGSNKWWRPGPDAEARLLGRRPSAGSAAIWSEALFKACEEKELAFPLDKPPQIGCDIARIEGGDDCVTVGRWGGVALCCDEANGRPLPATAAKIKEMATWLADFANKRRMELIKKGARPFSPKQIPCVIDSGYAGMGVIDLADGYSFIACNAGSHANEDLKYPNKRSELWFLTAERAMLGHVSFKYLKENHPEFLKKLKVQLMSPKWSLDAADRRVVEKKDHTHQRLGRSPDLADAVNLCYYQVSLGSAEWVKDDEGELAESMAEKVGLNGRGVEDRARREWEYGKRRGASSSVGLWGKRG